MTKIFSYSIKLNYAALLCFLLPFFYTGCEKKSETAPSADSLVVDSVALDSDTLKDSTLHSKDSTILNDTLIIDSLENNTTSTIGDSSATSSNENRDDLSLAISKKIPFLAPILISKKNTYSGVAILINNIPFLPLFSIVISFMCLIISLIAKYLEPNSRKIIFLLDIVSFASLAISRPASWIHEILYGYWIALAFVIFLVVCDLYILKTVSQIKGKD